MQRFVEPTILLSCIISLVSASDLEETPCPLYATLFAPHLAAVSAREALSDSLHPQFDRYTAALEALELPSDALEDVEGPLRWLLEKRHALTRSVAALTGAEVSEAASFAESCLLCYEWEGMSDCPLEEARCAEEFLKARPYSPLGAAVLLFVAHRYRSASECLLAEGQEDDSILARQRADAALMQAMRAGNPLASYMADELARAPWVYLRSAPSEPRDSP
ncbi:hypothetical protein JXA88_15675 [Candidatus Fermentibacteria bacterium]|nr:hypothetical protein [Candidatus Fermentibacteria bacterium]